MLIIAAFGTANTGLSGSVYYTIYNQDKTVATEGERKNTGITELFSGSGTYGVNINDDLINGKTIIFDINGTSKTVTETFPDKKLSTMGILEVSSGVWNTAVSGYAMTGAASGTFGRELELIRMILTNYQIDNGTIIKIHDDNNNEIGQWEWEASTGTRTKLTGG